MKEISLLINSSKIITDKDKKIVSCDSYYTRFVKFGYKFIYV